jgi:ribosomal-protein-serine acetyltransferase
MASFIMSGVNGHTIPKVPKFVETERLIVRCPTMDDVPAIYESVRESLPQLKPWMIWATDDYSLSGCEQNTREAISDFVIRGSTLRYHFHDKATGEHIGNSGFHAIDWGVPRFEIGYWLRSSKVGQGYATEGVKALTQLAFASLGAARVEIRCDRKNLASIKVAERSGFVLEGVLHNNARTPAGDLRDTCVYARVRAS